MKSRSKETSTSPDSVLSSNSTTAQASHSPGYRSATWLTRIARIWQRSRIRRESIRTLHGLSDRQLADIGVARGEIERVVDDLLQRTITDEDSAAASRHSKQTEPPVRGRAFAFNAPREQCC